jgi:transcriptional regulator with GAF, ATPase, and Fis domain
MPESHTTLAAPRGMPPIEGALRLSVLVGPDTGKSVVIAPRSRATIGTLPDNALSLSDRLVSRCHAELIPTSSGIALCDLGSSNGTFLGAVRITEAVIPAGTRVTIGETLILVDLAERSASQSIPASPEIPGLVYRSAAMAAVAREIVKCASFPGGVLIEGETGTGKEAVALALHNLGDRRDGPFVIVDGGALPANLVESQLFGHERGAFTGAERRRLGAFEQARGGTLFLDEIGELPLAIQPVLLGVLQRRRFRRVGGEEDIAADVRVIAATNRDLRAEINRKVFRADLYFRLAGARIVLPPLRDRPQDIPALWEHFVHEMTGREGAYPLTPEALARLQGMHFSGNVRELRSVVERAVSFDDVPFADVLPPSERLATEAGSGATGTAVFGGATFKEARAAAIASFERLYFNALMEETEQNASKAARVAGMDRGYLLTLLKRHGLR